MTRKVRLADVLWEAANQWLDDDQRYGICEMGVKRYLTCNAVAHSVQRGDYHSNLNQSIKCFLASLGCPVSSPDGFNDFTQGKERQGVRYMWLLLAMHVAEDEGIEIEVAA